MDIVAARRALLELTYDLVKQHEGYLPAGSVIRCVARCRDELLLMGVRDGLFDAVEAMARRRLRDRCAQPASAALARAV